MFEFLSLNILYFWGLKNLTIPENFQASSLYEEMKEVSAQDHSCESKGEVGDGFVRPME